MKPILQSLKKFSHVVYGAPLLVFLLPFVGQNWHLDVWRYAHKFAFIPLWVLLGKRLDIFPKKKGSFAMWVALFAFMVTTGMTGRLAYSHRSKPLMACLDSLILIVLLVILVNYAPELRKAYDSGHGPLSKKVPKNSS